MLGCIEAESCMHMLNLQHVRGLQDVSPLHRIKINVFANGIVELVPKSWPKSAKYDKVLLNIGKCVWQVWSCIFIVDNVDLVYVIFVQNSKYIFGPKIICLYYVDMLIFVFRQDPYLESWTYRRWQRSSATRARMRTCRTGRARQRPALFLWPREVGWQGYVGGR